MSQARLIRYGQRKLESILRQINELKSSDFPHKDSREALDHLEQFFRANLTRIEKLPPAADAKLVEQLCVQINYDIFLYLPVLGIIIRSTNVRNPFEFFDPLIRLSRQVLGSDAKLILSSEWDFSPMTYPLVFDALPGFVLLGLPTVESENALAIPLAGHELGHSLWKRAKIEDAIQADLQSIVKANYVSNWAEFDTAFGKKHDVTQIDSDMFLRTTWAASYRLARSQSEEVFCDILGVRLFGEAFLDAFEYLLAPSLGGHRDLRYPALEKRAIYLTKAAAKFGFQSALDYPDVFKDVTPNLDKQQAFLVRMADISTEKMVDLLLTQVQSIGVANKLPMPERSATEKVKQRFTVGVPADGYNNLADIVAAGWHLYRVEPKPGMANTDALTFEDLNEVMLKTIEVSEYHLRTTR